jgi:hypothetical protein
MVKFSNGSQETKEQLKLALETNPNDAFAHLNDGIF